MRLWPAGSLHYTAFSPGVNATVVFSAEVEHTRDDDPRLSFTAHTCVSGGWTPGDTLKKTRSHLLALSGLAHTNPLPISKTGLSAAQPLHPDETGARSSVNTHKKAAQMMATLFERIYEQSVSRDDGNNNNFRWGCSFRSVDATKISNHEARWRNTSNLNKLARLSLTTRDTLKGDRAKFLERVLDPGFYPKTIPTSVGFDGGDGSFYVLVAGAESESMLAGTVEKDIERRANATYRQRRNRAKRRAEGGIGGSNPTEQSGRQRSVEAKENDALSAGRNSHFNTRSAAVADATDDSVIPSTDVFPPPNVPYHIQPHAFGPSTAMALPSANVAAEHEQDLSEAADPVSPDWLSQFINPACQTDSDQFYAARSPDGLDLCFMESGWSRRI